MIRHRPKALRGSTYQMDTGCGPLYVTINEDEEGIFELFTTMGKAGGCASSQCEAIGRMVSLAWRSGVEAAPVIKQLVGICCHQPAGFGVEKVLSCADAVAKAIERHCGEGGGAEQEARPGPRRLPGLRRHGRAPRGVRGLPRLRLFGVRVT